MPQTYPCADTRCRGRALENGQPCPDCQRRIDKANNELNAAELEKEHRRQEYEKHKKGN